MLGVPGTPKLTTNLNSIFKNGELLLEIMQDSCFSNVNPDSFLEPHKKIYSSLHFLLPSLAFRYQTSPPLLPLLQPCTRRARLTRSPHPWRHFPRGPHSPTPVSLPCGPHTSAPAPFPPSAVRPIRDGFRVRSLTPTSRGVPNLPCPVGRAPGRAPNR